MKYLPYVLKHLKRNWIRTASTLAGLALCIFLICVLRDRARCDSQDDRRRRSVAPHHPARGQRQLQVAAVVQAAHPGDPGRADRRRLDLVRRRLPRHQGLLPQFRGGIRGLLPDVSGVPDPAGSVQGVPAGHAGPRSSAATWRPSTASRSAIRSRWTSISPPYRVRGPLKFNVRGHLHGGSRPGVAREPRDGVLPLQVPVRNDQGQRRRVCRRRHVQHPDREPVAGGRGHARDRRQLREQRRADEDRNRRRVPRRIHQSDWETSRACSTRSAWRSPSRSCSSPPTR